MTTFALPGYVGDVVALSGRVESSWGNAVRDRAAQIFDTTTDRDAALTVPQVGQIGTITTTAGAGFFTYSGPTVGWTPPWNAPWGAQAAVPLTSLSQAITTSTYTDVTSASATWTVVANRLYKVWAQIPSVQQSGTAGSPTRLTIRDAAGDALSDIFLENLTASGAGSRGSAVGGFILIGQAAGSFTMKLSALTSAGTATLTASLTAQGFILVEDIGPDGAPS